MLLRHLRHLLPPKWDLVAAPDRALRKDVWRLILRRQRRTKHLVESLLPVWWGDAMPLLRVVRRWQWA